MERQFTFDEMVATVGLDKMRLILGEPIKTEDELRAMWDAFRKIKPYRCPYDELATSPIDPRRSPK